MKELSTPKNNSFINFMGKMEKVGHMLINQEAVNKDSRQCLSVPEPFRGFMNSHNLV